MSEPAGPTAEALFRANKRTKIYRKRNVDDEDDGGFLDRVNSTEAESGVQSPTQLVKRPLSKKHGIGFSTAGSKSAQQEEFAAQTAVVPFQPDENEDRAARDRFVRPAGKTAVMEDKHLTAYVDSKLAELRTSSSVSIKHQDSAIETSADIVSNQRRSPGARELETEGNIADIGPKGTRSRNRVKPTRPRRGPPQRNADTLARDAMVDQIMRESQVLLYDQSSSKTQDTQPEGFDADEAAAEAFRAEFLLSLEDKQNRRRPAAPPVQQRGAPPVPTGPKLGGSRAQREKMKAIEEAKAAGRTIDAVPKRR